MSLNIFLLTLCICFHPIISDEERDGRPIYTLTDSEQYSIMRKFCTNFQFDTSFFDGKNNKFSINVQRSQYDSFWQFADVEFTMQIYKFKFDFLNNNFIWTMDKSDNHLLPFWKNSTTNF